MADSLESKLLQEIQKTGFPLELRVSDYLTSRGYYVANNLYYVDQDEQKGREVDIRALYNHFFKVGKNQYCMRNCLLIECKKSSDKPWVIFTSPTASYDPNIFEMEGRGMLLDPNWFDDNFQDMLEEIHPFCKYAMRGRSYFEAFKNMGAGDTIFKALTTSVKATISMQENKFGAQLGDLCFYYPIIVFDGKLFTAHLENKSIVIDEASIVLVTFSYQSAKHKHESFTVPIVTESAFDSFFENLEKTLPCWADYLQNHPNIIKEAHSIGFTEKKEVL